MSRGMTLVELVVVLAILGVSAGVALPAVERLLDAPPAPSAPIAAVLDRAREAALAGGKPVTVVLVPAAGRYWMWADGGDARTPLSDGVLALPAGTRLAATGPRARVRFDPTGRAAGDSIAVWAPGGAELVTVDRWTGTVHVAAR